MQRSALAMAACAGGIAAAPVLGQQEIYDNAGTFIAWWGQVPPGAAAGPEGGDQVSLGGQSRQVQQLEFWYQVGGQAAAGASDLRVRFYANDGAGGAPGTLIWDSGVRPQFPHISGSNHVALAVPNIVVPEVLTWTVEFTGRTGSAAEAMGLRIYDPPLVGTSDPAFFWSRFGGNLVPSAFQSGTPANLGARITAAGAPIFGACCAPDGSCINVTAIDCYAISGYFRGGSCGTPCPTAAACCFADGWCLELTEAGCLGAGGVWRAGVACAGAGCDQPLYANGPLATGKLRLDGLHAPYDMYWSDVIRIGGCETQYIGYNADQNSLYRHADNFTIPGQPGGDGWMIDSVSIYAFVAGGGTTLAPAASATLRIWKGMPGSAGAAVVWGDDTTDVLAGSGFTRIFKFAPSFPV
jgi:hypothetical protein